MLPCCSSRGWNFALARSSQEDSSRPWKTTANTHLTSLLSYSSICLLPILLSPFNKFTWRQPYSIGKISTYQLVKWLFLGEVFLIVCLTLSNILEVISPGSSSVTPLCRPCWDLPCSWSRDQEVKYGVVVVEEECYRIEHDETLVWLPGYKFLNKLPKQFWRPQNNFYIHKVKVKSLGSLFID